jgi:hypothetical protein
MIIDKNKKTKVKFQNDINYLLLYMKIKMLSLGKWIIS